MAGLALDFRQMRAFAPEPFLFAVGDGVYLADVDAKRYLDGLSGVFVTSLGHRNQAVIDAMTAQLQRLHFAPALHGTTPVAVELVEALLAFASPTMGAVKLLSGGSETTEAAMKLARGKVARLVDDSGQVAGAGVGISLMQHPENPPSTGGNPGCALAIRLQG